MFLFWQRYKDSNLNIRSQSPLCYRYTIPLCGICKWYYTMPRADCQAFFAQKSAPLCTKYIFGVGRCLPHRVGNGLDHSVNLHRIKTGGCVHPPYLYCYAVKNSAGITFSTNSSIYVTLKSACLMRAACFWARASEYCDSG